MKKPVPGIVIGAGFFVVGWAVAGFEAAFICAFIFLAGAQIYLDR